jgi:hypothetical protein
MYPDPSVSTALNRDEILSIRANKSCQTENAVAVMRGGRSACVPRTAGRLLWAARQGRDLHDWERERDWRAAFR